MNSHLVSYAFTEETKFDAKLGVSFEIIKFW